MGSTRPFSSANFKSPLGMLSLVASDKGLMQLDFSRRLRRLLHGHAVERNEAHPVIEKAVVQLDEYFAGRLQRFSLPLDLVGTPFQITVWKTLAKVRFGSTISYAEEAALVGRPTAVRAVGSANGRNPIPIVLPCHRIIAADGSLGGFSAGLPKKEWLLRHEREIVANKKQKPTSRVR